MIIQRPTDPYSPDWIAYWEANPHLRRGVGADAAEGGEEGAVGDPPPADPPPADGDEGQGESGKADGTKGGDDSPGDDWRADLPEDLKKTAERFASKEDAVRAIVAFQKREGQVRVPGKNASEDELAAYRKAVGIPESPEAYEFPDLPEDQLTDEVKASREAWAKRFHDLGVPNDTAKGLMEALREEISSEQASQVEADKAFAKSQEDALKAEWKGEEFDKNKTLANRAFSEIANRSGLNLEDLTKIETKDGRFLMDRAEMLKLFATIGREMSEGTLGPAISEGERETVEDEVRDLRRQTEEAQARGDSKRANQLYQKEQKLLARMGNKPVVGAQGRSV